MNTYAIIILAALLGNYILEIISDLLNLKALGPDLPDEFSEVYEQDKYQKSQAYTRAQTKFGFVVASFDLAILLVFWFSGGFNQLDLLVRSFGFGAIANGLLYMAIIIAAKTIISLPFKIYSTFVIEEKFGFNKTTPTTFIADLGKGLLLTLALGTPLFAGILYIFANGGSNAWFYCWIAVTIFILAIQFIAPTWIMPLFNKFTPLEDGELKDAIFAFAKSVDFSLENVFVMDGSKRSSKSNAFFTGFGKHKRIALFDTLIAKQTVPELVAILAHEIGHYKKKHILQGMIISIIHTGVMLFLVSIFVNHQGLFSAFYMENMSVYAGLIFFGLLFTPIELILSVLMNILSRHNEYEADRFAVTNTANTTAMATALKKLSAHNLSNLTPHPFNVFLHYAHPPLLTRIKAINSIKI